MFVARALLLCCVFFGMQVVDSYAENAKDSYLPLVRREHKANMTTSVIIPCIPKHFKYLGDLLEHYKKQTTPPDEVVVSLSEVSRIAESDLNLIEKEVWPFSLIILKHIDPRSAGTNRNLAFDATCGDIIICQDADDIPHPQRVEVIKHFFENYYIDHLMHSWFTDWPNFGEWGREFEEVQIDQIEAFRPTTFEAATSIPRFGMQNGNAAFARDVLKKHKWNEAFYQAQDVDLNRIIYRSYTNNVVLKARLFYYRVYLSSFW